MTKAFLPQMKTRNHGHIVTIASALGLFTTSCVEVCCMTDPRTNKTSKSFLKRIPYLTIFPFQDYCASKFGAVGFHESLAHELQAENHHGIKTTLVCPYIVDTGMFAGCEIR